VSVTVYGECARWVWQYIASVHGESDSIWQMCTVSVTVYGECARWEWQCMASVHGECDSRWRVCTVRVTVYGECARWAYLVEVRGDESDGVAGGCYLDEAAVDCVPHWGRLIHTMEQVTQPTQPKPYTLTWPLRHGLRLVFTRVPLLP
jgi:hypothetical protein